jgi:hypothetical protein
LFGQNFVVNTEPLLTMETFAYCDLCKVMLCTRELNEHLEEKNHSKKVADREKSTMQQKPRVDLNIKSKPKIKSITRDKASRSKILAESNPLLNKFFEICFTNAIKKELLK